MKAIWILTNIIWSKPALQLQHEPLCQGNCLTYPELALLCSSAAVIN